RDRPPDARRDHLRDRHAGAPGQGRPLLPRAGRPRAAGRRHGGPGDPGRAMILVAGGTGRLGSSVANRLSRRGLQVRALSRGTVAPDALDPEVEVLVGDVRDAASIRDAVSGATTVVSAVQGFVGRGGVTPENVDRDGNVHLVDAAEHEGCDVVLVSVWRAGPDGPMEVTRMKYAAEQRLRASTCPWTVVRPEAFAQTWIEIPRQTGGRFRRPPVFRHRTHHIS